MRGKGLIRTNMMVSAFESQVGADTPVDGGDMTLEVLTPSLPCSPHEVVTNGADELGNKIPKRFGAFHVQRKLARRCPLERLVSAITSVNSPDSINHVWGCCDKDISRF